MLRHDRQPRLAIWKNGPGERGLGVYGVAGGGCAWHRAARVCSAYHEASYRNTARLGGAARLAVVICAALVCAALFCAALFCAATPARAEGPSDQVMTGRSGFSFDLRLNAGVASAEYTESDRPVANFEAVVVGGAARFGWFWGQHVLLGAELAGAWHGGVGSLRIVDPSFFATDRQPRDANYGVLTPLGVFVEVYPWATQGWYASIGGAVGFIDLPRFSEAGGGLLSGYSLELGYELSPAAKVGPAPFVRYSRWAGEESPLSTDHPDGLVSRELLFGLRWSFWTPEWR